MVVVWHICCMWCFCDVCAVYAHVVCMSYVLCVGMCGVICFVDFLVCICVYFFLSVIFLMNGIYVGHKLYMCYICGLSVSWVCAILCSYACGIYRCVSKICIVCLCVQHLWCL